MDRPEHSDEHVQPEVITDVVSRKALTTYAKQGNLTTTAQHKANTICVYK